MKFILVIIGLMLLNLASAEKISFKDHSVEFNITAPHESVVLNDTAIVKTFDGAIAFGGIIPKMRYAVGDWIGNSYSGNIFKNSKDEYTYVPETEDYMIGSSMNLSDTLDFLRTMKVRKAA